METWIAASTGALAGLIHVLSGPDHLAAIGPLAVESRGTWSAGRLGFLWGLGHALGAGVVGLVALCLRDLISPQWISLWGERLVGFTLLAIGFLGLKRRHSEAHFHRHTALGVGTLHGLAGGDHFVSLLPALLFPTRVIAFFYVAGFGAGTVAGMLGFSLTIGLTGRRLFASRPKAYERLKAGCALASIAVGCFWIFSNWIR